MSLTISETGKLYLSGYYWKERGTGTDGIFLFTLDKSGVVKDEIWDDFSKEFITENWSERSKNKAERKEERGKDLGLTLLDFRRIVTHEDGSLSIVGERYWETTHTTTDSKGNTRTYTVYHYGDLIISRISNQGEVVGHYRYEKHHTYYGAYNYFDLNNDLAIITYKRKLDVMGLDSDEMKKKEIKALSTSVLSLIQISPEGEETLSGLMDYSDPKYESYRKYKLRQDVFLMEENEVLLLTYYGKKKFGIGRIRFK
ncbi:MAG: hypothetical protein JKY53_04915 [Flavobacteriales bacterium]|nr:hypothetical protein [Flavobacteriales bacterium]